MKITTDISLARRRGENAGIRDAYEHDTCEGEFRALTNPYDRDREPDLHEVWAQGHEYQFEERKRKP